MFSSLPLINQFPNNKYGFTFLVIRSVEQKNICILYHKRVQSHISCVNCYFKKCILELNTNCYAQFFCFLSSSSINVKRQLLIV